MATWPNGKAAESRSCADTRWSKSTRTNKYQFVKKFLFFVIDAAAK